MTTTARASAKTVPPGPTTAAYRRLLAILPPGYRREHGDELLDVYLEAAGERGPSLVDRLDVARLAGRTWGRALFLPQPQDRERWWAGTVIGVLGLLSFGAGRVVGDAVLAVWQGIRDERQYSGLQWWDQSWWSSAVDRFASGTYAWHSDWPVWFLWAVALILAVGPRRPAWAVVPAAIATAVTASTWLVVVVGHVDVDRRYLVFAAWGPMVRAGWLALQVAGFLMLVATVRRGTFLRDRDIRALRAAAVVSAVVGIATGSGMFLAWLLMSHDHAQGIIQVVLAAYLTLLLGLLVGTRTGRAVLPYAVPIGMVFVLPRALLLRVPKGGIAWGDPMLLPVGARDFLSGLTKPLALPRGWEALPFAALVATAAAAWFFGLRVLRGRRAASP